LVIIKPNPLANNPQSSSPAFVLLLPGSTSTSADRACSRCRPGMLFLVFVCASVAKSCSLVPDAMADVAKLASLPHVLAFSALASPAEQAKVSVTSASATTPSSPASLCVRALARPVLNLASAFRLRQQLSDLACVGVRQIPINLLQERSRP
jgi:hypothetical protein